MAVTFFPFNSIVVDGVPDRPANAENLAAYLAGFFSNGVLMQMDTALQVEAYSGMNVQIHAGMGNINGKTILADAAEIITLEAASVSLDRIDRVIFRLDEASRLMEFNVLTGTPASDPVAPELTQTAAVYELCLAEIRVPAGASEILASHITDTRADAELCGTSQPPNHTHDISDVGAMGLVKLWGNASPTSNFPAQNLTFDGEYDAVIITSGYSAEYIRVASMVMVDLDAENINCLLSVMWETNVARLVNISKTETGISIAFNNGGQYKTYGGTRTEGSSYCIPLTIYGLKGVQ